MFIIDSQLKRMIKLISVGMRCFKETKSSIRPRKCTGNGHSTHKSLMTQTEQLLINCIITQNTSSTDWARVPSISLSLSGLTIWTLFSNTIILSKMIVTKWIVFIKSRLSKILCGRMYHSWRRTCSYKKKKRCTPFLQKN